MRGRHEKERNIPPSSSLETQSDGQHTSRESLVERAAPHTPVTSASDFLWLLFSNFPSLFLKSFFCFQWVSFSMQGVRPAQGLGPLQHPEWAPFGPRFRSHWDQFRFETVVKTNCGPSGPFSVVSKLTTGSPVLYFRGSGGSIWDFLRKWVLSRFW